MSLDPRQSEENRVFWILCPCVYSWVGIDDIDIQYILSLCGAQVSTNCEVALHLPVVNANDSCDPWANALKLHASDNFSHKGTSAWSPSCVMASVNVRAVQR
jgi:hypothetical protein